MTYTRERIVHWLGVPKNPWSALAICGGMVVAGALYYLIALYPLQAPSWDEQIQIALRAAHEIDEDAVVVEITANPHSAYEGEGETPYRIKFLFHTPSELSFEIKLEESAMFQMPHVSEPRQRILDPDFVALGPAWFKETLPTIRISPMVYPCGASGGGCANGYGRRYE